MMFCFRDAGLDGELAVGDQVPGFAVHGHGVLRLEDVVRVEQLPGRGVAGNVDLGGALVHHVRAELHQAVDHAEDRVLVARDQRGGQDDGVALADADPVVAVGHAGQGCHGLALRTGGHQDQLVVRHVVHVLQVHQDALGYVQVAQLLRDGHVADHGAAHEADLAAVGGSGVEHLLHPVDVGGEGRDDDALLDLAEELFEHRPNRAFRGGEARNVGVGGVGHVQVHAFFAEPGEGAQVRDASVQRQLVHLEVTGVQDVACAGADEDCQGIRDGVVDGHELAFERAELLNLAFLHREGERLDAVFLQLRLDQCQRQLRTDQRECPSSGAAGREPRRCGPRGRG